MNFEQRVVVAPGGSFCCSRDGRGRSSAESIFISGVRKVVLALALTEIASRVALC